MDRFEYAVKLTPADEGGFVVTCRDLPQLWHACPVGNPVGNSDRMPCSSDLFVRYFAR